MYKQEFYKIFSTKGIYVTFLLVVGMMIFVHSYPIEDSMKDDEYQKLHKEWGGPITEEKLEKAKEAMRASDAEKTAVHSENKIELSYVHFLIASSQLNNDELTERKLYLQQLASERSKQTYAYRVVKKELIMIEKLGEPFQFYIIQGWRGMLDFITPTLSVVFLVALLFVGVTSVFADDFSQNRAGLILATKNGKQKLVTAKILAIITFIAVMLVMLHSVNAIFSWIKFGGFTGWNVPIQGLGSLESIAMFNYDESPFNLQIWQLYIFVIVIQFFGLVALSILVILLSIILKSKMNTLFVSSAIVGIPFMLKLLDIERFEKGIFKYIADFHYAELLKPTKLFETFKVYNVFGYPILYPTILIVSFFLLSIVLLFFVYNRYRHTEINN